MSSPYQLMIKGLPFNYSHRKIMNKLFKEEFEDVTLQLILNPDYYSQKRKDILVSLTDDRQVVCLSPDYQIISDQQ